MNRENKGLQILFLIFMTPLLFSQDIRDVNWTSFEKEDVQFIYLNKTSDFTVDKYLFKVIWDDKLSYSENIGFYGGVKSLKIVKGTKVLNDIKNIEDVIALNRVVFRFYDFNFDGYIDFALPISGGKRTWLKYYFYDSSIKKFKHNKNWDYLSIQKINKNEKLILTQPGGMEGNRIVYKIENQQLIKQ